MIWLLHAECHAVSLQRGLAEKEVPPEAALRFLGAPQRSIALPPLLPDSTPNQLPFAIRSSAPRTLIEVREGDRRRGNILYSPPKAKPSDGSA